MKPLVIANWKMYFRQDEALKIAKEIEEKTKDIDAKIVICPTAVVLPALKAALKNSHIELGAQNCSWEMEGALTGEISPVALKDFCDWVIIGHSERRDYLNETNIMVAKKIKAVLNADLNPIVCIGEHLEEYDRGDLSRVLYEAESAFFDIEKDQASKIILAYEPVWAISTESQDKARMTCGYAAKTVGRIRERLKEIFDKDTTQEIQIIYGGSVNESNLEDVSCKEVFSGFLVGSASRNPDEFAKICKVVAKPTA